ncbi:MAG: LytTR family transcriptional regulator [Segetibacter sp.]|nr:LytTR family transcriptional regulator [Segetibacter sp.]
MIRCIIIDDEPLAQQVLEKYVQQTSGMEIVKKCSNALEAFDIISKAKIDLMFLDIKMPSLNGIDFIRSLKQPPKVIFTTAFSEYAVESYELEAIDYLVKPVTYERFLRSMERYSKIHVTVKPQLEYSYFKINGKLIKVPYFEIIYARSVKDYIILKTKHDSQLTYMTMKYLVELLPKEMFSRVHRSYMINRSHIKAIGNNVIEVGDYKIPIGKNYKSEISMFKRTLIKF